MKKRLFFLGIYDKIAGLFHLGVDSMLLVSLLILFLFVLAAFFTGFILYQAKRLLCFLMPRIVFFIK